MDKRCDEGPGYTIPQVWRFLTAWAVFLLLLNYDPTGVAAAGERWLVRVVNYLGAPLYESAARDDIVIVMADTTARNELKLGWPLKYGTQADVIGKIMNQKPRMLAIDMFFLDQHREDNPEFLWHAIEEGLETAPIFGVAAPRDRLDLSIIQNEEGQPLPFIPTDVTTDATWPDMGYRLLPDDHAVTSRPASLALAMYKELCTGSRSNSLADSGDFEESCQKKGSIDQGAFVQSAFDRNMLVFWGSGLPDYAALFGHQFDIAADLFKCRADSRSFWQRLLEVFLRQKTAPDATCAFHPVIPLDVLMKVDKEVLAPAIKGKIVFYGVEHPGIADIVNPPTSHPIAGVHLHAMALDNLLTWGPDYMGQTSRSYPGIGSQPLSTLRLIVSLAVFIALFLLSYLWLPHEAERQISYRLRPKQQQLLTFSNLRSAIGHYLCSIGQDFMNERRLLAIEWTQRIEHAETWPRTVLTRLRYGLALLFVLMLRTTIGGVVFLFAVVAAIVYADLFILMVPPVNALVLIGVLAFVKLIVPMHAFTPGDQTD